MKSIAQVLTHAGELHRQAASFLLDAEAALDLLASDTDARDRRVAAWVRGVLLRTVAALPEATVRVVPVDGAMLGAVFAVFRPLVDAEAWAAPATDLAVFRAALAEAEQHIGAVQAGELPSPPALDQTTLLRVAGEGLVADVRHRPREIDRDQHYRGRTNRPCPRSTRSSPRCKR